MKRNRVMVMFPCSVVVHLDGADKRDVGRGRRVTAILSESAHIAGTRPRKILCTGTISTRSERRRWLTGSTDCQLVSGSSTNMRGITPTSAMASGINSALTTFS